MVGQCKTLPQSAPIYSSPNAPILAKDRRQQVAFTRNSYDGYANHSAAHSRRYCATDSTAASKKPITVNSPTSLPPCSNASGIMASASMVSIAPAANAWA